MSAALHIHARPSTTSGRWLAPLTHWPRAVLSALQSEPAVVRVLVASVRGSAPREAGACMLVGREALLGTIGGGYLEWEAQRAALALLADASAPVAQVRKLILGAELGQCCGGVVELWLERFVAADVPVLQSMLDRNGWWRSEIGRDGTIARAPSSPAARSMLPAPGGEGRPSIQLVRGADGRWTLLEDLGNAALPVHLYGAGHVGQALIPVLAGLPYAVSWIDPRAELLPAGLPDNVEAICTAFPLQTLQAAAPGTRYIVMTHDHALDYALCRAALERGDAAFVGVIGSHSKGARFRSRLARDGLTPEQIAPLVCPIGIAGIASKLPAAIAVGVVAQLLQLASTVAVYTAPTTLARRSRASRDHDHVSQEACTDSACLSCPQTRRSHP